MAFTSTVFRDESWLQSVPLSVDTVLDYFRLSPFYDHSSINEQIIQGSASASAITGVEFGLRLTGNETNGLFVIEKRRRHGQFATDVVVAELFYCLYGSIYCAPDFDQVLRARIQQSAAHINRALDALLRAERDAWPKPEESPTVAAADAGSTSGIAIASKEKERKAAVAAFVGSRVWATVAPSLAEFSRIQ